MAHHGLVLQMKDMVELEHKKTERVPDVKNPVYLTSKAVHTFVEEVTIIRSWLNAIRNPKNSKLEYFSLLRHTLMFMFSPNWNESAKKKDLLHAYKSYYMKFSTITPNCTDVYHAVFKIAEMPWGNSYLSWEQLFNRTVSIDDAEVSNYFAAEPEEIVLARVHSLVIQKNLEKAMLLAKTSFLYHSRIAGDLSSVCQRRDSVEDASSIGHASIDWFAFLLQRTRTFPQIVSEIQQLRCHEGIEMIYRLQRNPKNIKFSFALLSILIMEDLIRPSRYCCTKKLYVLFCVLHKEMNSSLTEVAESARKIFAKYAPSSSHLYLLVDVLWTQYGTKGLDMYVEFYVRGLTADINHLECKKDSNSSLASQLETHLATMFAKLSTLFSGFIDLAARECMFSAFSLRPLKERLYILQSLTQNLLSEDNNKKEKFSSHSGYEAARYCNCRLKCAGPCRSKLKEHVLNPLLNMGVKTVSYHLIKDLVCVLESARNIKFQYNMFDWQNNITELGDYLKTFSQSKMALKGYCLDTDVASVESDTLVDNENTHSLMISSVNSSAKRKNKSCVSNSCMLDVAANVEVESNDGANKKVKVHYYDADNKSHDVSEVVDPLETLIKETLVDRNPKSHSSLYALSSKSSNMSHSDARRSAFSKVDRHSPVSHTVHPYSLTDHGKRENLNTAPKLSSKSSMSRIRSSVECQSNIITHYTNENHPAVSWSPGRQSVVVNPSNPINRPVFQQQDARKTLPYSIQRSIVNPVPRQVKRTESFEFQNVKRNTTTENVLNLKSHAFQSHAVQSTSSPSHTFSKYTNLSNSTSTSPCSSKQQAYHDRNSVIHHTMQHVREKPIPISRELLVSFDHSHDHCTSKKLKESSASNFSTSVYDKAFTEPKDPTFGKLVAHNPSRTKSSTPNNSSLVTNKMLTVPGIGSSTQGKQNLHFTKITNTTITSSVYKPYALPTASKPQIETQRSTTDASYSGVNNIQRTNNKQTVQDNSWLRQQWMEQNNDLVSSINQNIQCKSNDPVTSNCQQWNATNAAPSIRRTITLDHSNAYNSRQQNDSNLVSVSTSKHMSQYEGNSSSPKLPPSRNQTWHSKPTYDLASTALLNNAAGLGPHKLMTSHSADNSQSCSLDRTKCNASILKSRLAQSQVFSSVAHSNLESSNTAKSYGFSQKHFSSQRLEEVAPSLPHTQTSSAIPINYNVNSLSQSNRPSNHSKINCSPDMYRNSVYPSNERGAIISHGADNVQSSFYSHPLPVSSSSTQKICCSPQEVDPCQSCSPGGCRIKELGREQEYNYTGERNPYKISDDASYDSYIECPSEPVTEELEDREILCHFCAFSYPASLMELHLEESHQNELLSRKNFKSTKKGRRDETSTAKPLPPMQFLGQTLLADSSPQSLSDIVKEASNILPFHRNETVNNEEATEGMILNSEVFSIQHKELEISWNEEKNSSVNHQMSYAKQFENSKCAQMEHESGRIFKVDIEKTNINSEKILSCSLCNKKVRSVAALKRHIKSCHKNVLDKKIIQSHMNETVVAADAMASKILEKSRCVKKKSISEDISQLSEVSEINKVDTLQPTDKMLKIKRFNKLRGITKPCRYCGKVLTVLYMKQHILKKHGEMCNVQNANSNQDTSLPASKDTIAYQPVSTLLQEDIDTRTCLSPSDALNIDERFDIAAHEHMYPSDSSVKTEGNGGMKFSQAMHSEGKNLLSKGKSKFKIINKSSQLTLKETDSYNSVMGMGENEFGGQSDLTESYRCHICSRDYTSKTYLNKHLQTFHKSPMKISHDSQPHSNASSQMSLPDKQWNAQFPDYHQLGKSIMEDSYTLNPTETSDLLPAVENTVQFTDENCHTSMVQGSDQVYSMHSDSTNAHSPRQFLDSEMQNCSNKGLKLSSDENISISVEKAKKTKPKNYKCPICPKQFSYSKNLHKHTEKDHSNNLPQVCIKTELKAIDSTFEISNQQVNNDANSYNMQQFDIEQTLQHNERHTHQKEKKVDFQNRNENVEYNSSYSSSIPSDKVSLSKSDSFFHSNECSSEDFLFQNDLSRNVGQQDTGSYSEKVTFETFHASPSAPSTQFSSPCSTYNENASYHSTEQSEINNVHANSNEICNGKHKSRLFTEMLKDPPDTSEPYQTSSFNNGISQSVYQQNNINLENSSVSTESNECPVCYKKMSTQDQLKHHIEKLHPMSSEQESTFQQVGRSFESQNSNMFLDLDQACPVVNSSEMCVSTASDLTFNPKNPVNVGIQEFTSFTSVVNQSVSTDKDETDKQELLLSNFCDSNFENNAIHSSFKELQQVNHSLSNSVKELYSSSAVPQTNSLGKQFQVAGEQAQKCDIFNNTINPIMLAEDSDSALKHSWIFSDLLEEFEAHTETSLTVQNKFDSDKCEHLSSNDIEIQNECHTNVSQNSSLPNTYITNHSDKLLNQNIFKKGLEKSDSEISKSICFEPENNFLTKTDQHSVNMHNIFSDNFLDVKSDLPTFQCENQDASPSYTNLNSFLENDIKNCSPYISSQTISIDEQERAMHEQLFSNDLENTSCRFETKEQCGIDTEKMDPLSNMDRLLENEFAEEISLLLNSGHEEDNFLSDPKKPSFINHSTDLIVSLGNSKKTLSEPGKEKSKSIKTKISTQKEKLPSLEKHICPICAKKLSQPWALKRHMKNVHPSKESSMKDKTISGTTKDLGPASAASLSTKDRANCKQIFSHIDTSKVNMASAAKDDANLISKQLSKKAKNSNCILSDTSSRQKRTSTVKEIKCSVCSKILSSMSTLKRHMQKLHPDNLFPKVSENKEAPISTDKSMKHNLSLSQNESGTALVNLSKGFKHTEEDDEFHISSKPQMDKAYVNPNNLTIPSSSTNLSKAFNDMDSIFLSDSFNENKKQYTVSGAPNAIENDKNLNPELDQKNLSSIKQIQHRFQNNKSRNLAVDGTELECNSKSNPNEDSHRSSFSLLNQTSISVESEKDIASVSTLDYQSSNASMLNPNGELCSNLSPIKVKQRDSFQLVANKSFSCLLSKKTPISSTESKSLDVNTSNRNFTGSNSIAPKDNHEIFKSEPQVCLVKLPDNLTLDNIHDYNVSELPSKISSSKRYSGSNDSSSVKLETNSFVGLSISNCKDESNKMLESQTDYLTQLCVNDSTIVSSSNTFDLSHLASQPHSQKKISSKQISNSTKESESQLIESEPIIATNIESIKDSESQPPLVIKVEAISTFKSSIPDKEAIESSSKGQSKKNKSQISKVVFSARKTSKNIFSSAYPKESNACRFCHKVFRSFAILSCHLKTSHQVPVLKKPELKTKSSETNIDKLPPPNLSFGSSYDSDSASTLKGSFQSKMSDVVKSDLLANVPIKKSEVLRNISAAQRVETPESIKDSLIEEIQRDIQVSSDAQLQKTENEVQHSKLKASEKDTIVKNNIAKRRSQRGSCEIIMIKTCRKSLLPKKKCRSREIQKRFGKCKNQSLTKTKSSLSSFTTNKRSKKTYKTIASPPCDNSALPKCIIKVCKDEKNSVFYQIESSPDDIKSEDNIFQFPESSSKHLDGRIKKKHMNISPIHSRNMHAMRSGPFRRKRKRHTVLASTIKSRACLKLLNSSSVANSALESKCKKIKISATQPSQKFNLSNEKLYSKKASCLGDSDEKAENYIYSKRTFKESKEIQQFLIEHKQPLVRLQRLASTCINGSHKFASNLPEPTFNFNVKPILSLIRIDTVIDLENNIASVLHQNNKLNSAICENSSQGQNVSMKTIASYSVTPCEVTIEPLDMVYNSELSLETFSSKKKVNSDTFKMSNGVVNGKHLNPNQGSSSVDSDPQEKSVCFPLKECSVILKRMAL